jgi:NSS family neurotransmitter:Na+ symporter
VGSFIGALFFVMVLFAALTSSVGMMEGFVSGLLEKYPVSRRRCTWISFFALTIFAIFVSLTF